MRIPRFAFVSMLVLILVLSGSLALVRARNRSGGDGPVLALTFKVLPDGYQRSCFVLAEPNKMCGYSLALHGGELGLMFRFISRGNKHTELGVRAAYRTNSTKFNSEDLESVPERIISVEPSEEGQIEVAGVGEIQVMGQYVDHQPIVWGSMPDEPLPPQNEFAAVDPVLIRGNQVVCDLSTNGYSIDDDDADAALMIYYPGQGRYLISSVPFEGAVEGAAKMGQIRFSLNGESYLLLSGVPILRSNKVWVSHDPDYRISDHIQIPGASDDRTFFRVRSLKLWLQPGIIRNIN